MNTYIVTVSICSLKDHYTLEVNAKSEKEAMAKAAKESGCPVHGCIIKQAAKPKKLAAVQNLRRKILYPKTNPVSRSLKKN